MHQLTSTTGIVAIVAGALAIIALLTNLVLALRLRRLRRDQLAVLGEGERRQDLVGHAAALQRQFLALADYVRDAGEQLSNRVTANEQRLDGAVAYRALVRYDAYGEMSGHQSTSIALLDASCSGIVLSSIHHRDTARLYAKQLHEGRAELELSPEEDEAVKLAMSGRRQQLHEH